MGEAGIWATCNVGATKPEEYGDYFAWGETEGYADAKGDKKFTWNDYKFDNNPSGSPAEAMSKYNKQDGLYVLEPEDDAAHIIMGDDWRMPTNKEFDKLKDLCNLEWVENYNKTNINGYLFTLKTDESKQLFFPAAGRCEDGSINNIGS